MLLRVPLLTLVGFIALAGALCSNPSVVSYNTDSTPATVTDGNPSSTVTTYGSGTCLYRFTTTVLGRVQRASITWALGAGSDRLSFYDGMNASAPLITTAASAMDTSMGLMAFAESTGGVLFVALSTDGFQHTGGFSLTVSSGAMATHCSGTVDVSITTGQAVFSEPGPSTRAGPYGIGVRPFNCGWTFTVPAGAVQLFQLAMTRTTIVPGDYIELYRGGTLAARYGHGYADQVDLPIDGPSTNEVRFISSGGDKRLGFNGPYFVLTQLVALAPFFCSGQRSIAVNATGTVVNEPSDPLENIGYRMDSMCEWLFTASAGQVVSLAFSSIGLWSQETFVLYDGGSVSAPVLAQPLTTDAAVFVSNSNQVLMRLVTRPMRTKCPTEGAFTLLASAVSPIVACAAGPVVTSPTLNPLSVIASSSEVVASRAYAGSQSCAWSIQGGGEAISLLPTIMSLNAGDSVIISKVDVSNVVTSVKTFTGPGPFDLSLPINILPPYIASVVFTSGAQTGTAYGFSMDLNYFTAGSGQCSGTTMLTTSGAFFAQPSTVPFGAYLSTPNTVCYWKITMPTHARFSLNNLNLGVGSYLAVYDGASEAAPLITNQTGLVTSAQNIDATGTTLYVKLVTGGLPSVGFAGSVSDQATGTISTQTTCSLTGSRNWPTANGLFTISVPDLLTLKRGTVCTWTLIRNDYTGSGGYQFQYAANPPLPGDTTITVIDGASATTSPLAAIYGSNYVVPSYLSAYPSTNQNTIIIVLTVGQIFGAGSISASVQAVDFTPGFGELSVCASLSTFTTAPAGYEVSPTPDRTVTLQNNMHCSWLLNDTSADGYVLVSFEADSGSFGFSINATVHVYDGDSASSPEIPLKYLTNTELNYATRSQQLFITFNTSATGRLWPAYGFKLFVYKQYGARPSGCAAYTAQYVDSPTAISTVSPFAYAFASKPEVCRWELQTLPGATFLLESLSFIQPGAGDVIPLAGAQSISVYEGPDEISSKLLFTVSVAQPTLPNLFSIATSTTNVILVVMVTDAAAQLGMEPPIVLTARPVLPPPPCSPNPFTLLRTVFYYCNTFGSAYPRLEPNDGVAGQGYKPGIYATDDFQYSALLTPQVPGDCTFTVVIPEGYGAGPNLWFNIEDGYLEILENGVPHTYVTGFGNSLGFFDLFGNVTFHAHFGPNNGPNAFWQAQFNLDVYSSARPYYTWASSSEVPCMWSPPLLNSPASVLPYANCTIMPGFTVTGAGMPPSFSMPNLRTLTGPSTISGIAFLSSMFPNLEVVSYLKLTMSTGVFNLPSLLYADQLDVNTNALTSVVLPKLINLRCLGVQSDNNVTLVSLPSLTAISGLFIRFNPNVATISTPQLVACDGSYDVDTCPSLTSMDTTGIKYIKTLELTDTNLEELRFDAFGSKSFPPSGIELNNMPSLKTLTIGNATSLYELWVQGSNPKLSALPVEQLYAVSKFLYLWAVSVRQLSFPKLLYIGTFQVNDVKLVKLLDAPKLLAIGTGGMTMLRTSVATLNMPSLVTNGGVFCLQNDYNLAVLNLCALESAPNVRATNLAEISCFEFNQLFTDKGVHLDSGPIAPPNCLDNVYGTFGCRANVTRSVNVTACGFNLACIQKTIDVSYRDANSIVAVPAGTFTGCSTPLNPGGRNIRIQGAGEGATVIDCQNMGTAFVIVSGESPALVIRDMTLKNGLSASSGGLVHIEDASPTFIRVTLTSGMALSGGLISASGLSSGIRLVDCILEYGQAAAGGALSLLTGASARLEGSTLQYNTATQQGGAVDIIGGTGLLEIMRGVFGSNAAPQGGAVFTDSALVIGGGALFSTNSASQFGGAVAAVTADAAHPSWVNTSDCTFEYNRAQTGGAILSFSAQLALGNGTNLSFNSAAGDGGAVAALCSPSYIILDRVPSVCQMAVILDHVIASNNTAGGNGGVVHVTDAELSVQGGLWRYNHAVGSGGGVYATASDALVGGGVMMEGNVAEETGGAVYCEPYRGDCHIQSDAVLANNLASIAGGGVFFCAAFCPSDSSNSAPNLLPIVPATVVAGNNVAAGGYGPAVATDATTISYSVAPDANVVSGQPLSSAGSVVVGIYDAYNTLVTVSATPLAVSLSVVSSTGSGAAPATVIGSRTALAVNGYATFAGGAVAANSLAATGQTYTLTARLSGDSVGDSVVLSQPIFLMGCPDGLGYDANATSIVCQVCAAGSASSTSTGYVCQPCAAGTFAADARAAACQMCPSGTYAAQVGAAACVPCTGFGKRASSDRSSCEEQSGIKTYGPYVGGSLGGVVFAIILALILYRCTRRRTMQKYYLDEDSTVRVGEETPLMKAVRRILGSSTTSRVGGGQYADVFRARYENVWIALKVLKKEHINNIAAQTEFRQEAVALGRLAEAKCAGILAMVFFNDRNPACIATEFCIQGPVKKLLRTQTLGIYDKLRLVAEAAAGMTVVHSYNIVHLDLKTDNLLLDAESHVKVADFGISRALDSGAASSNPLGSMGSLRRPSGTDSGGYQSNPAFVTGADGTNGGDPSGAEYASMTMNSVTMNNTAHGSISSTQTYNSSAAFTPQYVDPVRLVLAEPDAAFLKQTDVFTFGIVMWAIYAQDEPHTGVDPTTLVRTLKDNPSLRPPPIEGIHREYDRIMRACWDEQPSKRPTFAEVLRDLLVCLKEGYGTGLAPGYLPPGFDSAS